MAGGHRVTKTLSQEHPRQAQRRQDGVTTEDWQWRRLNLTLKVRDAVRESGITGSLGIAGLKMEENYLCRPEGVSHSLRPVGSFES